ncbi:MAG: hypothetical protein KF900_05240 [Bacteroidetes bacterium]|nr:hypothetical protein [Bacteroidota bacterium]
MNAENIKSELQQVLDNDLALRKEFVELKRSLSDYRNQLISRDEDCKRLQVSIDVLNTKLEVVQRDNAAYKQELEALSELRSSVNEQLQAKQGEIEARLSEIEFLKNELDNISSGYETQLEHLKQLSSTEIERIIEQYNTQIQNLKDSLRTTLEEQRSTLTLNFNSQIERLTNENTEKQNGLLAEYEEKLATVVLHANQQNSKLSEEVKRLELNAEILHTQTEKSETELQAKNTEFVSLLERFENLNTEHENLKQTALLNNSEQQVNELQNQMESLNGELQNMVVLFEENTNKLAETESELEAAGLQITTLHELITAKDKEAEELNLNWQAALALNEANESKDLEFQKLLAENSNLINEIETAFTKNEAQETEINLLKTELEEMRAHNSGKVEDLKETLNNKNFEILNLEANNASLVQEIEQLKQEVQNQTQLVAETTEQVQDDVFIDRLFKQIDALNDERLSLLGEKEQMAAQILKMNEMVSLISQRVDSENIDVKDLNNHRMNVILATQSEGTNEKNLMKEQINDLVREIDKCIALLSA